MKANINKNLQWIELSNENLKHNIDVIKSFIKKDVEIAALLKANAYGHGIEQMSYLYKNNGITTFMVHTFKEALIIKNNHKDSRIILIGPLSAFELEKAIEESFEFVVFDEEILKIIIKIQKKIKKDVKLHLKIETGTYRLGIAFEKLKPFLEKLKKISNLNLMGVYSHFANIEDTSDTFYFKHQLSQFQNSIKLIEKEGFKPKQQHIACSAAVLLYKETHFDLIRPGISLYGYFSSPELAYALKLPKPLKPVLSWKTVICQIKNVKKGESLGYGLTYKTTRHSKIGILPIGYCDGYDRKLSNVGVCLVNGKRAQIRGRICMNMTLIDLTDIKDAKVGSIVTLIGSDKLETITADDIAKCTNTISYEVLARLSPLIPKIII